MRQHNFIITPKEFATFKDVGKKIDVPKLNNCIDAAQNVDLYDKLGAFLFNLIENKDHEDYQDLLNGSSFEYSGKMYYHQGIKSVLSEYIYARLMYQINVNVTPFGAVGKNYDDSTPTDRNLLKDLAKQSQIDAGHKFDLVDKYLKSEASLFSTYSTGDNPEINTHSIRFWKL